MYKKGNFIMVSYLPHQVGCSHDNHIVTQQCNQAYKQVIKINTDYSFKQKL